MPPIKLPFKVRDEQLLDRFFEDLLPEAIDLVKDDTQAAWGEMSPQHMVEHLIFAFRISTGRLEIECHTPESKRDKLRSFLERDVPMPRGFTNPVTGDTLPALQFESLEEAKKLLKEEVNHFLRYYEEKPEATHINPMFGELGYEMWKKFHFKHCFHHLAQFEVVKETESN